MTEIGCEVRSDLTSLAREAYEGELAELLGAPRAHWDLARALELVERSAECQRRALAVGSEA